MIEQHFEAVAVEHYIRLMLSLVYPTMKKLKKYLRFIQKRSPVEVHGLTDDLY